MDISEHLDAAATPSAVPVPPPERGQRVFLDGPPDGPWRSFVTGRAGDLVAMTAPTSSGAAAAPPAGSRLRMEYVLGDVPFEAEAEIVEAPPLGGPGGCTARLTRPPSRIQRRGAVRVPVRLFVTASLGEEEGAAIPAITDNLSAGGALLRTPRPLAVGRQVRLLVECGGATGALELIGRCLRCDRVADGTRPWRVAITFQGLGSATGDRLIRLVLERQREARRPTEPPNPDMNGSRRGVG